MYNAASNYRQVKRSLAMGENSKNYFLSYFEEIAQKDDLIRSNQN